MARLRLTIDLDLDNEDYLEFPNGDSNVFLKELEGCNVDVLVNAVRIDNAPRADVYCHFGMRSRARVVNADIVK